MMEPGKSYWVKMKNDAVLTFQQQLATKYYYHPDHLGSSSVVTDDSGTVVERTEFYPFGRSRLEQRNDFESAYKFTGKERDKESGFDYFGARYYLPVVGSFISVDPLYVEMGEPQSNSQSLHNWK